MCGHVGLAGRLEYKDEATIKRMLLFDYFRGTDSTGIAVVSNKDEAAIVKIASHPIDLFDTKSFTLAVKGFGSKLFLGHNRAATKGKVSGVNAHPYQYGHIIGAHNGTLSAASWTELNKSLGYETDVDSMAIFAHIEKFGIEATVPLLQGAWALVWHDLDKNTVNFLRNGERTFWFAQSKAHDKILWSSEWPTMQASTEMSGAAIPYELAEDEGGYTYFPTKVDMLYSFDMEQLQAGDDKFYSGEVKILTGKEPPKVVTTYTGGNKSPFTPLGKDLTVIQGSGTKTTEKTGNKTTPAVVSLVCSEAFPFGGLFSEEAFEVIAMSGCSWCSGSIDYAEKGVLVLEKSNQILCSTCTEKQVTTFMATPATYNNYIKED